MSQKLALSTNVPGAWGKLLNLWASPCSSVRWVKEFLPHSVLGTSVQSTWHSAWQGTYARSCELLFLVVVGLPRPHGPFAVTSLPLSSVPML